MTIRMRITAVAVTVVVFVALVLIGFQYRSEAAAEARYVAAVVHGKRVLWEQMAALVQERMAQHTKAITRDSVGLKALHKGDHDIVREQAETTHNLFSADGTLDRLQIFGLDGSHIAAFPQSRSGPTRKTLVKQALEDAKAVFGINRDDDGSLQAAVAFPLFVRGKMRGVAVYSRGVQGLLDEFQQKDGSDVFIVDLQGRNESAGAANTVELPDITGLDTSAGDMTVIETGGQYRVTVLAPITDENGSTIARLVTSQDQSASYSAQINARRLSIVLVFVIVVGAAVGLYWYFRRVFKPINETVKSMTAVAAGRLNSPLPTTTSNDETGHLTRALTGMVTQLRQMIGSVGGVTQSLVAATENLTDIAEQGNRRMAVQRIETDQVATAANQMAATNQDVAANASMAAAAARRAANETASGRATLDHTISAAQDLAREVERASAVIDRLRSESENIGSVLDVIRGIAEQTNLLALNSAIEAARAGEQGRGFAVVADEVRTLATRTQQSTQDINGMIENLQLGASEAVSVMAHGHESSMATLDSASTASAAFATITESVAEINAMNEQIASATVQQSSVSEMISRSVSQIATLAEESTQAAAETARAATGIAATGHELEQLIRRFDL